MAVFALRCAILLMGMGTRDLMCNTNAVKERIQGSVFPTPICLHNTNISVKLMFNKVLKISETSKHLRLMSQKINPSDLGVVIDETDIIGKTTNGGRSRTQTSEKTRSKGLVDALEDFG